MFVPITQANGTAIRVIRERSELSIRDMVERIRADGVDVHPDHLRNIELGHKQPSARLLGAIARALQVPKAAVLAEPAQSVA